MKQDQAANPTESAEARFEKLSQKLVEAFNRGDMTEAGRIRQEMENIGQELNAAYDKRDRAMESAARQHEAKDVSVKISLVVNSLQEDLNGFTPTGSLDGMPVFRSQGEYAAHTGWQEGVTMVFAGPGWNILQDRDAVWMSAKTREAAYTEAQTLVVRIRAEEGRAQDMMERLDWDALRGLLR